MNFWLCKDNEDEEDMKTEEKNDKIDYEIKMRYIGNGIRIDKDSTYLDNIEPSKFNIGINFETDLSFDRIYKEIYQFDVDNNHLQLIKLLFNEKNKINNGVNETNKANTINNKVRT